MTTPLAETATAVAPSAGEKFVGLGKSSSSTVTVAETEKKSVAVAVITELCVPSARRSSTPEIEKVTDDWPSGIVTVAGTVAADVVPLASATTSAPEVPAAALRVTVPVATPPFSLIDAGVNVTVRVGASAVVTLHAAVSEIPP